MELSQVAVVILNWNGKAFLEKFLPSVIKYSGDAKIYLADNQSTDDSVSFVKNNFQQVNIILNPSNEGFAKGYNTALKSVKEKYYVLLNSDVEVSENWLDPLFQLMESDSEIGACQPKILDYQNPKLFEYAGAAGGFIDKNAYPFCRGRIFNTLEQDNGQYDDVREVFWATGACMFVRAETFWFVGGFDDDYFAHMEEIDLCWRMKNCGYKIYVQPQSKVFHVGGGTLNKLSPKKTFLNFRNNLITLTKNSTSKILFLKIIYRMVLDGIAGVKFLAEGNANHCLAVVKAHFAFYTSLSQTLKKRKAMKSLKGFEFTQTQILKQNIVFLYFLKYKKVFSELGKI
jgi:GT2 family glycosyltransferase